MLLNRVGFRQSVFYRDHHQCVICGAPVQDAHHIMERRLFDDEGYYIENGASVCGTCHILAETTQISTKQLRDAAGIKKVILPPQLYPDVEYDKWGNIILPNGQRLKGELFYDESVQKILHGVLGLFTNRVKFPRTWHLPWSPGKTKDDRVIPSTSIFEGKEVVVTEKMDGENSTVYSDYCHARSLDSDGDKGPSSAFLKNLTSQIGWMIPEDWRVCGENLFIKHSIFYSRLPSHFLMFSIWNNKNEALSWDETVEWAQLLGLETVDVLYRGIYDEDEIQNLPILGMEGYVVRTANGFQYGNYRKSVAKYVRAGHVQTSHHWKRDIQVKNERLSL